MAEMGGTIQAQSEGLGLGATFTIEFPLAEEAIGAARAGASIVHLHARGPADGRPTQDPEVFRQFLPRIKAAADVVVNLTTAKTLGLSVTKMLLARADEIID